MTPDTQHDTHDEVDAVTPRRGRRREARNGGRRLTAALVPLAILASGAMVYQASNAAFTATTSTPANNWTSGTVALRDDDTNAALFNLTNIRPGVANGSERCITLTYEGSLAAGIRMFASGYSSPASGGGGVLGNFLRITVEESSTASPANCSAFTATGTYLTGGTTAGESLDSFRTARTDYASGTTTWAAPASSVGTPAVRTYRVRWWLPDLGEPNAPSTQAALDALQNATVSTAFVWEARNT